MIKILEFLFFRWKIEIHKRGSDTMIMMDRWTGSKAPNSEFQRHWIEYKYTNKFDGSVKIKRKYIK